MWVIAWRPFSESGMFVHRIGDLNKGENAIIAKHGLTHAKRFNTKAEAMMLLDSMREMKGHDYWKDWVIVSLGDHYFG
jgi:hypothetical protein